jgi:excisionase family DNA binding protein
MRAKELLNDPIIEDELPQAVLILAAQMCKVREAKGKNGNDQAPARLLSLQETAERLGVSKSHVYHVAKDLEFMVKIGRRVMFSEQGLEEYIADKKGKV